MVDITNFLTFDLNRPLHVFDAGRLDGDLTVRFARPGETLLALNGQEYALDPEITAIADSAGVQSLGGVIGGEATGCTEATTEVFIEAALFDPVRTAATGRKLNIASDARYRFERGLDPAFVKDGLEIATRLILELCGGEASEIVTAGAVPDWRRRYVLRAGATGELGRAACAAGRERGNPHGSRLRGRGLAGRGPRGRAALVAGRYRRRGRSRRGGAAGQGLRPDPGGAARTRDGALSSPAFGRAQRRAELVRRTLAARGLTEAVTFSFIAAREAELFGGVKPELRLVNPISADLDAMRPSLLPGLVAAARRNADRGFPDAALFELGPLYRDDTPVGQILVAGGVRSGQTSSKALAFAGARSRSL